MGFIGGLQYAEVTGVPWYDILCCWSCTKLIKRKAWAGMISVFVKIACGCGFDVGTMQHSFVSSILQFRNPRTGGGVYN